MAFSLWPFVVLAGLVGLAIFLASKAKSDKGYGASLLVFGLTSLFACWLVLGITWVFAHGIRVKTPVADSIVLQKLFDLDGRYLPWTILGLALLATGLTLLGFGFRKLYAPQRDIVS